MKLGFLSVLSIILVIAKLVGVLNISWFLALLPFLIEVAIGLIVFIIIVLAKMS